MAQRTSRTQLRGFAAMCLFVPCANVLSATVAHAEAPVWGSAPPAYRIGDDGTIEASDGGASTADQYLLTQESFQDFILSFDLTRLEAGGDKLRAIAVWAVAGENRSCFFLPVDDIPVGEARHFEVTKLGASATLKRDGDVVSISPVPYGEPASSGPVGLLHYFNYHFRYANIILTPLDAAHLPAPTDLRAEVGKGGVVTLRWQMPEPYAGLVKYAVQRNGLALGAANGPMLRDHGAEAEWTYGYRVAATVGDEAGPLSEEVTVTLPRLPQTGPVVNARGVVRIDGSVRLSWELPEDARTGGFEVWVRDGKAVPGRLDPSATSFLVPPSADRQFLVANFSPEGDDAALTEVEATPPAPVVTADAPFPTRHPYLRYSAGDMDRVRQLAREDGPARKTVDALRAQADSIIRQPLAVPREPSDENMSLPGRFGPVAQAYFATGDDRYAAWVREAMLAYADLYPTLPVHGGGRARIVKTASGLYEAVWYVPLICAYDLTYDSPVYSQADHERIARDLLRPAAELFWVRDYADLSDPRVGDLHYRCYNFEAWFISAVGLTGLLLRDPEMVEHAIDGPYGLKHLLAHDVQDDGVFWERSLGYHGFVQEALLPFLEAATHCNLDLWRMEVADDYNQDREPLANYCLGDGDNGPKSLGRLLAGPLYALFGDRSYANISDSNAGPLRAEEFQRVGWHRTRDPGLAWLYWQDHRPPDPEALKRGGDGATVRLAYDDGFLYVAADVTDDVVRNTHEKAEVAWAGDALWVGLKWRDGEGGPYDFIWGLTPGDLGATPPLAVQFTRFALPANVLSAGRVKATRTAAGYVLEAAIPWDELTPRDGEPGTPLRPAEGAELTADFVLYDGDPAPGEPSTKERMLCWACTTDRYDSAQGGKLVLGPAAPEGERVVNAPRVAALREDGFPVDWDALSCRPAVIGGLSTVMTDAATAGPDLLSLIYDTPAPEDAKFDYLGERFCGNGVLQAGCWLYPSTGFAILRERLEDGFPPVDATCAALNFGPHGGGHGHSDKLSLVLYADGKQWLPDFGSCGYDSVEKSTWTAQTISHNTLVVDEISQFPTGSGAPTWPCDAAEKQARGFLDLFHCDDVMRAAAGRNTAVYAGVALRRTVALVSDALVDFCEAASDAEHQYDYPLHIGGPLLECSAELTGREGTLGARGGYQHVGAMRAGMGDAAVTTLWGDEARKLRISCGPAPGTEVIAAEGITTNLERKMPMLILRRHGKAATFATVMQPYTTEAPAEPRWLAAPGGAVAVRLPAGNNTAVVVFNPSGRSVTVDGITVSARLTTVLLSPQGTELRRSEAQLNTH